MASSWWSDFTTSKQLNVLDPGVALERQTTAGSVTVMTARGQSSFWGGLRPCSHGDLRVRRTGLGKLHKSIFSSAELQLERPGSEHTLSGARWACPEGATPLARGRSAAGRWCHGNDAITHHQVWRTRRRTCKTQILHFTKETKWIPGKRRTVV